MQTLLHLARTVGMLLIATVFLGACNVNVNRNTDGSLTAETTVSEETIQSEIAAALSENGAALQDVTVDLRDGAAYVSGTRPRPDGSATDTISFRLDLGVSDGKLTVAISEAQLNNNAIEQERIAQWNERIAQRLERLGQNQRNSTLQSVNMSDDVVTMVWRIETRRSQGS